jgi:phospholipid/cholesterol/gamma-HCH transport system ATP-binding protein
VIMLYPLFRLRAGEPQIVFEGTPAQLEQSRDPRIRQFVEGRAGTRLMELREEQARLEAEAAGPDDAADEEEMP